MSKPTNKFSPEVRERAVRLVLDTDGQKDRPVVLDRFSTALMRPKNLSR